MFDSSGGDVKVLEKAQPKTAWFGGSYHWNCVPCNTRSPEYATDAEVRAAGEEHVKVKHPGGKPEWLN